MSYLKKRRSQGKQIRKALKAYRQAQAQLAIFRDGGACVFHKHLQGKFRAMEDVHHVYGRARRVGDPREKYYSLLCTCRECHPQPIKNRPAKDGLAYVEEVLLAANVDPLNPDFEHPDEEYLDYLQGER